MKSDIGGNTRIVPAERIESRILLVRGQKVLLDTDLAALYEVDTKALKRAVRRNLQRYPPDFMFQLTRNEWVSLRCQIGTSNGRGGQAVRSVRLHRARSGHALECAEKRSSRTGEHRDHADIIDFLPLMVYD